MNKMTSSLSEMSLGDYRSFPISYKVEVKHGYIYVLKDSVYPEYVKLGMSRNLQQRYKDYNAHKPYNTAEFIAISDPFEDAIRVEKKILEALIKRIQPIGAKKEWFEAKHEGLIREVIEEAEAHFHSYIPAGDIYANDE
jgi:hypothetical protein